MIDASIIKPPNKEQTTKQERIRKSVLGFLYLLMLGFLFLSTFDLGSFYLIALIDSALKETIAVKYSVYIVTGLFLALFHYDDKIEHFVMRKINF